MTFWSSFHGEQAIIVVPGSQLVFVMTAGNYMQIEKRPFEIMEQYITQRRKWKTNTKRNLRKINNAPQIGDNA